MPNPAPNPHPHPEAADAPERDGRALIDGARQAAASAPTFPVRNPYNGALIADVRRGAAADVDRAVLGARRGLAHSGWDRWAPAERAGVLRRLAEAVVQQGEALARLDTLQVGIPISVTRDDIGLAAHKLLEVAMRAEVLAEQRLPGRAVHLHLNQRRPHGVVAAITPWNFPLFVALGKVGPALAAGNAVVLKPSELAPLACLRLGDLALGAGVPPGVLQVVPGLGAEAGQALAEHPGVDLLSFTGSTATGRALLRASAGSNLKALHLELGGKSPQVVLDDLGDLDRLAQRLAEGFTFNAGQVCVAGSRLIVPRGLADALLPRVAEHSARQVIGDPLHEGTTLGPLASPAQRARVQGFIDRAKAAGAREHRSGAELDAPFLAPRVFSGLAVDAELMQEEVFGPVAAAIAFDTEDEAVTLANATRYGLSATVWSTDLRRGLAVAERLRAGHVSVHTSLEQTPSGARGVSQEPCGESGFGAEGGDAGLLAFTRARHLAIHHG